RNVIQDSDQVAATDSLQSFRDLLDGPRIQTGRRVRQGRVRRYLGLERVDREEAEADRWQVQSVVMTIDCSVLVQVIQPLPIGAHAPVEQRIYADMPSPVIVPMPRIEARTPVLVSTIQRPTRVRKAGR